MTAHDCLVTASTLGCGQGVCGGRRVRPDRVVPAVDPRKGVVPLYSPLSAPNVAALCAAEEFIVPAIKGAVAVHVTWFTPIVSPPEVSSSLARTSSVGVPAVRTLAVTSMRANGRDVPTPSRQMTLLYLPGAGDSGAQRRLVWVDREGGQETLDDLSPDAYTSVQVSPDGTRLALEIDDAAGRGDVWTYDLARGTRNPITTDPARDHSPLWTPDGQQVVFTSYRAGSLGLYRRNPDGTGEPESLMTDDGAGDVAARALTPSSVRAVLYRELYRGEIVWNQTKKRDSWGVKRQRRRPESEWVRVSAPNLRIVSDELWAAAHARLDATRLSYLRTQSGLAGKYLLTGLARCGVCGGGLKSAVGAMGAGERSSTRAHRSIAVARSLPNRYEIPMQAADVAVTEALLEELLTPDRLAVVLERLLARAAAERDTPNTARVAVQRQLAEVETALDRLTAAVAAGGDVPALVEAIKTQDARRRYGYPRISPDGSRVALDIREDESDIWIWNFERELLSRFTVAAGNEIYPVWTPDGDRLMFGSDRAGLSNLYWRAADGSGDVHRIVDVGVDLVPYSTTPDGEVVVVRERHETGDALSWIRIDGEGGLQAMLNGEYMERNGELAPNGDWIAYESNETGQFEIYVRSFPDVQEWRWQVSTAGGTQPLWSRDSSELFYVNGGTVMATSVLDGETFATSRPEPLFSGPYGLGGQGRGYDISPDGELFLVTSYADQPDTETQAPIRVYLNWSQELLERVPID